MRWYMVMFESPDHERVVKVMRFDTMKQMAYILDVSAQKLSNIYHGLVKPKGLAKYVIIYHV